MIDLTISTVVRAALTAYVDERLSAQGPTPKCSLRDPSGRPCALGAAMTDDEAATPFLPSAAFAMVSWDWAYTDDVDILTKIQRAHDYWVVNPDEAPRYEREFVQLLESYRGR